MNVLAADVCKIKLLDVEKAKKEEKGSFILLGEFRPTIGEDLETTEHFRLPGEKEFVTVTVIYTDGGVWVREKNNSLLADSIIISLSVSKKKEKSAFLADSVAHLSPYRESTTLLRLSRIITVNKNKFELEVECWCNDSEPWVTESDATEK